MVDTAPQFETKDNLGSTLQFVSTVGITAVNLPSADTFDITEVIIRCPIQTPNSNRLLYSFNLGSTYSTLSPGEWVSFEPRQLKHISIKGNVASVSYEVLINQEPA